MNESDIRAIVRDEVATYAREDLRNEISKMLTTLGETARLEMSLVMPSREEDDFQQKLLTAFDRLFE